MQEGPSSVITGTTFAGSTITPTSSSSSSSSPPPPPPPPSSTVFCGINGTDSNLRDESHGLSFEKRQRENEIRSIQRQQQHDHHKNDQDINRVFQNIYSSRYKERQEKEERQWIEQKRSEKFCPTFHPTIKDPTTGQPALGCKHYVRNCKLKANCCGVFVTCRLCHDDHPKCQHEFVRTDTKEILCMKCHTEQKVGRYCVQCGVEFAKYYCEYCKFYDSTPGKDIYHCPKCGICRLGKGLGIDNEHCDKCNGCISKDRYGKHKCLPKSLLGQCPICNGDLFTTMKDTYTLKCGHWIHSECCDSYRQTYHNYTCPVCHKSMYDLSEKFLVDYFQQIDRWLDQHQMPDEYKDKVSYIYCYDCEKRSIVPYHFVFHRCANPDCRSYNTHTEHIFRNGEPPPAGCSFMCSSITTPDVGAIQKVDRTKSNQNLSRDAAPVVSVGPGGWSG